jgi:hypothetical protein
MTISLEQCFMDRARLASRPPVGSDLPTLLLKARTRTEVEKGKLLELKAKVAAGKFVDADEVKVAAFNKARIVRDALLNIASRLAPLIAAETDERACFDLIDREVRQALDAWFALDPSEHRAQGRTAVGGEPLEGPRQDLRAPAGAGARAAPVGLSLAERLSHGYGCHRGVRGVG